MNKSFGGPHKCPVCNKTIFPHRGSFDICDICGWEDDPVQEAEPDFGCGANEMCLNDYKEAYMAGWRPEWLEELQEEQDEEMEALTNEIVECEQDCEEEKKGIGYKRTSKHPFSEKSFREIQEIISGMRDILGEYLVVELEGYRNQIEFIQTTRTEDGESYLVEVGLDVGKKKPQLMRLPAINQEECISLFQAVCVQAEVPDFSAWVDITVETFFRRIRMNIFKYAYKVVRDNSSEIYKGFGFKHLSDATQYYVHPDNQSYDGTTSLCQSIGEALVLFASMLRFASKGDYLGDFLVNKDKRSVFLEFCVPEDYHVSGVIDRRIYKYRALSEEESIEVAAYDENGVLLPGDMEDVQLLYKLLPSFMVLLGREIDENTEYRTIMDNFLDGPTADVFVNLHEDFYQNHKLDDYILEYKDLSDVDTNGWYSWAERYAVIGENKDAAMEKTDTAIVKFSEDAFNEEQKTLIPNLSSEFVLPENLISVCNAVANGDLLAVLFHGPAGTGKTISCKLVAQSVGLPIMETINCTENLDEFVLGKYIPQDDKIVFKESYVTKAIRDGGAVVFEEINFAKPQYLAFLNSLLDDNGFVRLDNGEVVKRNPNFRFFATMNMGYFGTKDLNQALYNRFSAIIEVAALSDESITLMLTTRVPECTPMIGKILGVYHKIKKKIEAEELDVVISPRNLENWARLAKYDGYVKAAEKTLIPIAKCDRALEDTIRGIMMLYKWKV